MLENRSGVIKNAPVFDLRYIKGPEDLNGITAIEEVGLVLVPEEYSTIVSKIPMTNVGGIFPIAKGDESRIKVVAGQTQVSCSIFSNPDDIILLIGQIVVTYPLSDINCRLAIAGQILFPEPIRAKVSTAIMWMIGQVCYYKGERVQTVLSEESFSKAFFETLEDTTTIFNLSPITIEDDVTPQLLKDKISDLIIYGPVMVSKRLKPLVQALATQRMGPILVSEDLTRDTE